MNMFFNIYLALSCAFLFCLFCEVIPEVFLVLQGLWDEQLWRILNSLFCCHTFLLHKFIVRALRCYLIVTFVLSGAG